jgi:hypothetical protein
MRQLLRVAVLASAALVPAGAHAAAFNRIWLVPGLKECPGPGTCLPVERASTYTFDRILLRSSAARYSVPGKVTLIVELKGVRDASGALVSGPGFTVRTSGGRIGIPSIGTFPDSFGEAASPTLPLELRNGAGKLTYRTPEETPPGIVTNGGQVFVLDPAGNVLATSGTQGRP